MNVFLATTAVDDNGSGKTYPVIVRVDAIDVVMALPDDVISGAHSIITIRHREYPLHCEDTFEKIIEKLREVPQ